MSSPLPDRRPKPVPPPAEVNTPEDGARERLLLARKWAYLVSATTYIPLPYAEIERILLDLVDRLCAAATSEPLDVEAVRAVGRRLIELNCVQPNSLHRTVDILGKALLGSREPMVATRVVPLLGALTSGYAESLRAHILMQQEHLAQSVLQLTAEAGRAAGAAKGRLDEVLAGAVNGVAIVRLDGEFALVNDAFAGILGRPAGDVERLNLFDVVSREDRPAVTEVCRQLLAGTSGRVRHRRGLLAEDGEIVPVSLGIGLLRENDQPVEFVVTAQDNTEVGLLQRQLTRQSLHDVLTGLPNRQFFTTQLETTLHRAAETGGATVYHLDLDGFAVIADGLGRRVGDQILKSVADRLRSAVASERAVVARFDGDEFAILVETSPNTPDVAATVRRINDELAEPVYVDGHGVTVSAAIGVVHRPHADAVPTEVLRASDVAVHQAKRRGRRQWQEADPGLDARERSSVALAAQLASAWREGRLAVTYRPVVLLAGERPVALDAVLRWDHPTLGPLSHERCVELAARTGFLESLGEDLLRAACVGLPKEGWAGRLPCTLALTEGQSAMRGLVEQVLGVLDETGVPAGRLNLGIPVTVLLEDDRPAETVRALAGAGIGAVLHEFGGGVAELARLEDLPVTGVRIARRLVERVAERPVGPAVAAGLANVVSAVHLAGATAAVDGVDDRTRADRWRELGADTATGLLFGALPRGVGRAARERGAATVHSGARGARPTEVEAHL